MALDITRLSGGNTPADGSDPRTFPAIWNATATALEADVIPNTITTPTAGDLLQYDGSEWVNVGQAEAGAIPVFADATARTSAIPSPTEGMVTYRSDDDVVEVYNGASFVPVGPGMILQVVHASTSTQAITTSTSVWSSTNLSVSITPTSASSKVLVFVSQSFRGTGSGNMGGSHRILRDSTVIWTPNNSNFLYISAPTDMRGVFNMQYLDSPATTSSITYSTEHIMQTGGSTFGSQVTNLPSEITVMEVAA